MIPVTFPEANLKFGPPPDLAEPQCMTIPAHVCKVAGGSVDGSICVVVAWKPSPEEIQMLQEGKPIFLSCLGGLPPHFLTTQFELAIKPS
jgi:hypothetical protein